MSSTIMTMIKVKEQLNCTHFSSFCCFVPYLISIPTLLVDALRNDDGRGRPFSFFFLRSLQHTEYLHLDYMIISWAIWISILYVCSWFFYACVFCYSLYHHSQSKQHENRHWVLTKEVDQFAFCNQHTNGTQCWSLYIFSLPLFCPRENVSGFCFW